MERLFALADLHLSTSGDKPMHIFGEHWRDHADRMAAAWDERVGDEDVVLLPGDLSWARKLDEARGDLDWIGARPGRKLLLKGNHDTWWSSVNKVRAALPEGCDALQNNAFELERFVVVGARGWTAPEDPIATEDDGKLHMRELERLRLSILDADRRFGRDKPRVAMLHFPPWLLDQAPTRVIGLLQNGGVSLCVYGHLHGDDHRHAVTGVRDGIDFRLVAADAVDFAPVELP
ncbi:hypothetical protein ABI59_01975 [Acidobacteria bacterium Mor1]|nr:hypothetical protein ABI59_01975 [Acidobacteria bacterium Mor1]